MKSVDLTNNITEAQLKYKYPEFVHKYSKTIVLNYVITTLALTVIDV